MNSYATFCFPCAIHVLMQTGILKAGKRQTQQQLQHKAKNLNLYQYFSDAGQGTRSLGQVLSSGEGSVLQPCFLPNPKPSDASEKAEGCYFYASYGTSKTQRSTYCCFCSSNCSAYTSWGPSITRAGCQSFARKQKQRKNVLLATTHQKHEKYNG